LEVEEPEVDGCDAETSEMDGFEVEGNEIDGSDVDVPDGSDEVGVQDETSIETSDGLVIGSEISIGSKG